MDLRTLIGSQEGIQWFEYKEDWEFQIAYISKGRLRDIQRAGGPKEWEREFYRQVVKDWRGLTPRKLTKLCLLSGEVDHTKLDEGIPFTLDNLLILVDAIYEHQKEGGIDALQGLDSFILEKATNFRLYQPADFEAQIKNSLSGAGGTGLHKDSPVESA